MAAGVAAHQVAASAAPSLAPCCRAGFVWDRMGHVVTNYHVIRGASDVLVREAGPRTWRGVEMPLGKLRGAGASAGAGAGAAPAARHAPHALERRAASQPESVSGSPGAAHTSATTAPRPAPPRRSR